MKQGRFWILTVGDDGKNYFVYPTGKLVGTYRYASTNGTATAVEAYYDKGIYLVVKTFWINGEQVPRLTEVDRVGEQELISKYPALAQTAGLLTVDPA